MRTSLRVDEARRLALAAQGFGRPIPSSAPTRRAVTAVVTSLGLVQIDSVNVVVRSHYLPAFSRLGVYDRGLLDRAAYDGRSRSLFEYWGHEASLIPVGMQPLFRWRMERAAAGHGTWGRIATIAREQPAFVERLCAEIAQRGPLSAGDFDEHRSGGGGWWGWSDVKTALEYLFWSGRITTAKRRNFERLYDLTERVLPAAVVDAPTPDAADAQRQLLLIAARALGIASARDLRDYFRLDLVDARPRLAELVDAGELLSVAVEGWREPAYVLPGVVVPRSIHAQALLSPFDSLVWERSRDRRMFDFDYRLEIYTPAHKRVHGYYVLPFLYGDRLVARVDCKSLREQRALRVIATHYESSRPAREIRDALATELRRLAQFLDLDDVTN